MIGGHGHVRPRPDGLKARCGGPALCVECAREAAALKTETDKRLKPFLAFCYDDYYPNGAANDFVGDFDSIEAVLVSGRRKLHGENLDILNTQTGEWTDFRRTRGKGWKPGA